MRGVAGLRDAAAFLLRVVLPRALRVRRLAVTATAAAATVLSFAETAAAAFSRLAASTAAAVADLRVRVFIPAVFRLMAELLACVALAFESDCAAAAVAAVAVAAIAFAAASRVRVDGRVSSRGLGMERGHNKPGSQPALALRNSAHPRPAQPQPGFPLKKLRPGSY